MENPVIEVAVDVSDAASAPATISEGKEETVSRDDIVSEIVEIQGEEKNVEYLESEVLNVVVPISISVTIDPLELKGKGQIYSKDYKIQNKGDSEVLLTFGDIELIFSDEANFKKVAEPFNDTFFKGPKTIYMELGFGARDIPPAVITANNNTEPIVIPLSNSVDAEEEDSHLQFNFSGCVNETPNLAWKDNDVTVNINYSLQTVRINELAEQDQESPVQGQASLSEEQVPAADEPQTVVTGPEELGVDQGPDIQEETATEVEAEGDDALPEGIADEASGSPPSDSGESSEAQSSPPQASTQATSSESGEDGQSTTGESSAE